MADESILDKFGSFFSAGNMNDPRVNSQLRQRIALQMMTQGKKGYPKTLGEGLTAIGDSLGDIGMARQLAASDIAGQEQALRAVAQPAATPMARGAPIMNYAPEEGGEAYQPAPQQPVQQAAPPQVSVLPDQGAPPSVVAGPPPAETYTPPTPEQVNSSRNALTRGLLARQPAAGGPPPNPMLAGAVPASISTAAPSPSPAPDLGSQPDQRLALNAPPQDARGAVTDIRPAPPMPSPLRQEPPQQMAQAQQSYPAGYVPPPAADPTMPPTVQMHPRELQLRRLIAQNPGNPYYATAAAPELATLTQDREKRQAYADELFKAKLARGTTLEAKRTEGQMDQASRIANVGTTLQEQEKRKLEIDDAREKSTLQARLGGRAPEQFFTEFDKEKGTAEKTVNALNQYATSRDLLDKGVITGTAQGWKVNAYKVAAAFGVTSAAEAVTRTEQLQASMQSTLGLAIDTIQGAGQKVSDADMKMASGTSGADPALQVETIKSIISRAEKLARTKLNDFEDQRDYYLGGTRAERRYQVPVPETAPAPHVKTLLEHRDSDEAKAEFDRRFGHGAADLELARAKRRERRGG